MKTFSYVFAVVLAAAISTTADAETRVTYKSAKNTSSYYQMAVQIAEAMKKGSKGDIIVTVEETPLITLTRTAGWGKLARCHQAVHGLMLRYAPASNETRFDRRRHRRSTPAEGPSAAPPTLAVAYVPSGRTPHHSPR